MYSTENVVNNNVITLHGYKKIEPCCTPGTNSIISQL